MEKMHLLKIDGKSPQIVEADVTRPQDNLPANVGIQVLEGGSLKFTQSEGYRTLLTRHRPYSQEDRWRVRSDTYFDVPVLLKDGEAMPSGVELDQAFLAAGVNFYTRAGVPEGAFPTSAVQAPLPASPS